MKRIILCLCWCLLILTAVPFQNNAFAVSYSFCGSAELDDPNGLLGDQYPDIVEFNGAFDIDLTPTNDPWGNVYYSIENLKINFPGFSALGGGLIEEATDYYLWSPMFYNDAPSNPDIDVDKWGWGEIGMDFGASPSDFNNLESFSLWFFYVYDYDGDCSEFTFDGTVTDIKPVPEPATLFLLCCGVLGVYTNRKLSKKTAL